MTHDELLAKINRPQAVAISVQGMGSIIEVQHLMAFRSALYAVVELHKPTESHIANIPICSECEIAPDEDHDYSSKVSYPCPTIQVISKELK